MAEGRVLSENLRAGAFRSNASALPRLLVITQLAVALATGSCIVGGLDDHGKLCLTTCPSGLACINGACGGCDATLDTDSANCGWCGHSCGSQLCAAGACQGQHLFFSVSTNAMSLTDGVLYLAASDDPVDGGIFAFDTVKMPSQPSLLVPHQRGPNCIAAKAPYVFWATADGFVRRALEGGGSVVDMASGQSCSSMAANSSHVYWWDSSTGRALRLAVTAPGAAPEEFAPDTSGGPSALGAVGADDSSVIVTSNKSVEDINLASGAAESPTLPGDWSQTFALVAGEHTYVAYITHDDEVVHIEHIVSGTATTSEVTRFSTSEGTLLAQAADATGVFWVPQNAAIAGCDDSLCVGGARSFTPSAVTGDSPSLLAVDSAWLYVYYNSTNEVWRYPR